MPTASRPAATGLDICWHGPAVTRPSTIILTCADDGELATHLRWTTWSATRATATGIVTWREFSAASRGTRHWGAAAADVTLTDPMPEPHHQVLFTELELHVTGPTPKRFMRDLTFDEAPLPPPPHPARPPSPGTSPVTSPVKGHRTRMQPSGTLSYGQIEGYWVDAGGSTGSTNGYPDPEIAAAITYYESSYQPGVIQPYVDYCTLSGGSPTSNSAGWGLWQITCGNEVPQYGTDFQLLDPWNNAEAAVYLFDSRGFEPWATYTSGAYTGDIQDINPDTGLTDPGEYEYIAQSGIPSGTPSSPSSDPGSVYGSPMAAAYAFWMGGGTAYDLWEAQGAAVSSLSGPTNRGYGTLGSAPAVGVDGNGYTYVFWQGTSPQYDLYEAYWNGSSWSGPVNRGEGPLGSAPTVAVTRSGTAYVFWEGQDGNLWEAQGPANPSDGALSSPTNRGYGPLGSAPTAGVDSSGATYVYWEGTGPQYELYEAYWNGSGWTGPVNRGQGPLGSQPSVAITPGGTAYVFWEGTDGDLWEAQGPANASDGSLSGPTYRGYGPLGSNPAAGVDGFGNTFVYWEGTAPQSELYEAYWNGSGWTGPYNRGQGPLGSAPTVAIYSYTVG
jgi:hypothetical protein